MKRLSHPLPVDSAHPLMETDLPVNAIDGPLSIQVSTDVIAPKRPRILERRHARFARRANR